MSAVASPSQPSAAADPAEKSATVTPISWTPKDGMSRREWQLEGRRLSAISKASPWWVGDWLAFGAEEWGDAEKWGDTYKEARNLTGYDRKTLRNRRYVSMAVPREIRVPDLTWSHHALVAGLKREDQVTWLERALRERLAVDDLRTELRAAQRGGYRKHDPDDPSMLGTPRVVTCPECGCQVPVSIASSGTPTTSAIQAPEPGPKALPARATRSQG